MPYIWYIEKNNVHSVVKSNDPYRRMVPYCLERGWRTSIIHYPRCKPRYPQLQIFSLSHDGDNDCCTPKTFGTTDELELDDDDKCDGDDDDMMGSYNKSMWTGEQMKPPTHPQRIPFIEQRCLLTSPSKTTPRPVKNRKFGLHFIQISKKKKREATPTKFPAQLDYYRQKGNFTHQFLTLMSIEIDTLLIHFVIKKLYIYV